MDRKQFLAIVGRSALLAAAAPALEGLAEAAPAPLPLDAPQRALLVTFADELIPATDGMPSASEMGAAAYLERAAAGDEAIAASLRDAVASIERRTRTAHDETFDRLPAPARVALLQSMEKDEADRFRAARDLVYEAYYTNPLVWKRLGYDFVGAADSGPPLEPFEEALLERVRALPRLYRAVP
jgi:Gluconate 2-dehydrogenase subunit 3